MNTETTVKLSKVERDQDKALEMFIHRIVFAQIATYEQLFACLGSRQCLELRQENMNLKGKK